MTATMKLTCGGCDAKAETPFLRRTFRSFNGSGHGFGVYEKPDLERIAAEMGWTLWDAIGCTYCPSCSKELFADDSAQATSAHQ